MVQELLIDIIDRGSIRDPTSLYHIPYKLKGFINMTKIIFGVCLAVKL